MTLFELPDFPSRIIQVGGRRVSCKICRGDADLFDVVDFNKHCSKLDPYRYGFSGTPVYYHICRDCQFVFTKFFDDWDVSMFSKFIYNQDYVRVDGAYTGQRPANQARWLAGMFGDNKQLAVLDYGSGTGLTADHLAGSGYTGIACYDPFSNPVRPQGSFDIVVSLQVIEHSPTPLESFRDMVSFLNPGGAIICATGIMDVAERRERGSYWYIGPRNGHASIFTRKAMHAVGKQIGLAYHLRNDSNCFVGDYVSPAVARVLGA